jgi:hypothetical protein
VLLEQAQEDADHGVAVDVVVGALLEEDVGLVEQDDCVPLAGHLEDVAQLVLELVDGGPEFADRDGVERFAQQFRNGLGRQRLADARRPVQQEDAAPALAVDDVLERALLVLDERLDQRLALGRQHQLFLGLVVVLDRVQTLDGQLAPLLARERKPHQRRAAHLPFVLRQVGHLFVFFVVCFGRVVLGVEFFEGREVDHAPPDCALLDRGAVRPPEQGARLRQVVRPDRVLLELLAAVLQCLVLRGLLVDDFDAEVVQAFKVVELADARAFLAVEEDFAVGADDLDDYFEERVTKPVAVVDSRDLAADEPSAVLRLETDLRVDLDVQVELVEHHFAFLEQTVVVRELGLELGHEEGDELEHAFGFGVGAEQAAVRHDNAWLLFAVRPGVGFVVRSVRGVRRRDLRFVIRFIGVRSLVCLIHLRLCLLLRVILVGFHL